MISGAEPMYTNVEAMVRAADTASSRKEGWAAMFQQTPLADVGAIFPRAHVRHYRRADLPRSFKRKIITVDATFKDAKTSDFVAVGVWGLDANDNVWLIDKRRERLGFVATAQAIADLRGKHPDTHRIYIEEAANGAALIEMLQNNGIDYRNWSFYPVLFIGTAVLSYLAVRLLSYLPYSYYIIGYRAKAQKMKKM